jgi:hypothetical protein
MRRFQASDCRQNLQVRDSSVAETLPGEDADFDFRLIEPTAVSGGVVHGEPVPDFAADRLAEKIGEGFTVMAIQVVQDQMDGLRFRLLKGQMADYLSELNARTIWCGTGEVASRFGLYGAENISRATSFIFVIPSCLASRRGWRGGTDIGMQRYRLLNQAHYGVFGVTGPFIRLQDVRHVGDVRFIEFGHAPHFFPATA